VTAVGGEDGRGGRVGIVVLGLALLLTLVNALQPITVDDTIFFYYARQIAQAPFDPYGFDVFWEVQRVSALDLFAPVGMPYWWALGMRLVGDNPVLWKLWMFPFAWLLVWALHRLVVRFVGRGPLPLVALIVLGPTVLPAFNLMIDLPSLALALAAMVIFLHASDREQPGLVVIAGLVAALAIQTKFTAFAPATAITLYAALHRKWRFLAIFVGVTAGAFAVVETALYLQYGTSHFLRSLEIPEQPIRHNTPWGWAIGWVALAGALAGPLAVLAVSRLVARPSAVLLSIALAALPFVLIAMGERPSDSPRFGPTRLLGGDRELVIFFAAGVAVVTVLTASISSSIRMAWSQLRPTHVFLLGWFVIELVLCFTVSPFHASRRMIGPIVVGTLLVAHGGLLSRGSDRVVHWAAVFSALLGALFATADILDARARHDLHDEIASSLREHGYDPSRETVWFTGHWGFQFEAERRGYLALVAGDSVVERGDWLLLPNRSSAQPTPQIRFGPPLAWLVAAHDFPLSTIPSAYMAAVAIRRQPLAQNRVTIHRIEATGRAPLRWLRAGR